jgi:hypothetical protein
MLTYAARMLTYADAEHGDLLTQEAPDMLTYADVCSTYADACCTHAARMLQEAQKLLIDAEMRANLLRERYQVSARMLHVCCFLLTYAARSYACVRMLHVC